MGMFIRSEEKEKKKIFKVRARDIKYATELTYMTIN